MLKVKIDGTAEEISAFFERIKAAEGLSIEYKTKLSKRHASHVWASCKAGVNAQRSASDATLPVEIYQAKDSSKKRVVKKQGYVYCIPAYGESGVIGYKIGQSANLKKRRATFSVKFNFRVEYLAVIYSEDCRKLERELHTQFKAGRIGRSEFFALRDTEIGIIKGMMSRADKELLAELNAKEF